MLLIVALSTTASVAQHSVVLSAWVERALYCRQSNNQHVFQLLIGFTYENTGKRPLIIPRFGVLAGYEAVEQRQGKIEEAGENLVRLSGPNLPTSYLGLRRAENGKLQGFLRDNPDGPESAVTEPKFEKDYDAWNVAFEMYRQSVII